MIRELFRELVIFVECRYLVRRLPARAIELWPRVRAVWRSSPAVYGRSFGLGDAKKPEYRILEALIQSSDAEELLFQGVRDPNVNVTGYSLLGLFTMRSQKVRGNFVVPDSGRKFEFHLFPGYVLTLAEFVSKLEESLEESEAMERKVNGLEKTGQINEATHGTE